MLYVIGPWVDWSGAVVLSIWTTFSLPLAPLRNTFEKSLPECAVVLVFITRELSPAL